MDYIIAFILISVAAAVSSMMALPIYKILQLSGYKASGVFAWWKSNGHRTLVRFGGIFMFSFIAMAVFLACFGKIEYLRYFAVMLYLIMAALFVRAVKSNGEAKLVYTGRAKRMIAVGAALTVMLAAGVAVASYFTPYCQSITSALGGIQPFVAIAANAITSPFEKLNNKKYIAAAKAKLKDKAPVVIGITGSFGKTTAKNLLAAMLAGKTVYATPASYNTPMGVCKAINEGLADEKYFIAELGARYAGDIKELCDIVSPKYGIITAVGDMHLATLGSRAGVADAKFELAAALPTDGLMVYNGYNADAAALGGRQIAARYALTGERVSYSDIVIGAEGTAFTLNIDGSEHNVSTKLLGAHIPELVCCAAAVALELGVTPEEIVAAVEGMQPVEHRLQLLTESSDVAVIDDAYNSNPVGAKNALEVLSHFDGVRVIITPGFVELGKAERALNTELGKDIAACADVAYLVGSRAADIKAGATDAGMSEDKIKTFGSRDEAVDALKEITEKKAVLFENDLPDNIR